MARVGNLARLPRNRHLSVGYISDIQEVFPYSFSLFSWTIWTTIDLTRGREISREKNEVEKAWKLEENLWCIYFRIFSQWMNSSWGVLKMFYVLHSMQSPCWWESEAASHIALLAVIIWLILSPPIPLISHLLFRGPCGPSHEPTAKGSWASKGASRLSKMSSYWSGLVQYYLLNILNIPLTYQKVHSSAWLSDAKLILYYIIFQPPQHNIYQESTKG